MQEPGSAGVEELIQAVRFGFEMPSFFLMFFFFL